ncbi:hypothetical protein [Pleurocapsa sp. PCC 7319]|uniref:hypothetical protein n=1 Tax=Pleurocapsa sp. PCC 7319 TaxID=118161 RepID=UPI00034A6715|nr:hypothetical protein [Pleurocapsa sp. PCC 7319]
MINKLIAFNIREIENRRNKPYTYTWLNRGLNMSDSLNERLQEFIDSFELVFDIDWDFTKESVRDEYLIKENGTFLDPFPEKHFTGGKGDNWSNRSSLLAAYRELKAFAISEGLYNPDKSP